MNANRGASVTFSAFHSGQQLANGLIDCRRTDGALMGLKGRSLRRGLERITRTNDAGALTGFSRALERRLAAGVQRPVADPGLLLSPQARVHNTGTGMGLGVYATCSFRAGEVVEICPVILIAMPAVSMPKALSTRVFNWARLLDLAARQTQALALGFGSMYNHDGVSNMRYEAIPDGALLRFTAVRDIVRGEELTINYNALNGGCEWHDNNWFDRNHIQLLTRLAKAGGDSKLIKVESCSDIVQLLSTQGDPGVPLLVRHEETREYLTDADDLRLWRDAAFAKPAR